MTKSKIDPFELRSALGAFVTGVTIVTTRDVNGTPRGFTANSFTSVSLDPPLVLVCLAKTAGSVDVFQAADGYAVNILSEGQRDLSNAFASDVPDRFERAPWTDGPAGNPVFQGTAAWLDCTKHKTVDAGDHLILIGEVRGFQTLPEPPLGYCRGAYVTFGLEQEAVAASGRPARVGAILESEERIFLLQDGDGNLSLPTGPRLGDAGDAHSLLGRLSTHGLDVDLGFLFAVYENKTTDQLNIFYRGAVKNVPKNLAGGRFVPFGKIDPSTVGDEAEQSMMGRYLRERTMSQFGIYVGDAEQGRIHPIEKKSTKYGV